MFVHDIPVLIQYIHVRTVSGNIKSISLASRKERKTQQKLAFRPVSKGSPHDEHWSSSPGPVKLCSNQ